MTFNYKKSVRSLNGFSISKGTIFLILFLFILINHSAHSAITKAVTASSRQNYYKEKPTETIDVKIIPLKKDALFNSVHPVAYFINVHNHYKTRQEGKIGVEIKSSVGTIVTLQKIDFSVKANKFKNIEYMIPVDKPGFYDIIITLNLTDYDDTIRNVFGYKTNEINTAVHKPADFDQFWEKSINQLSHIAPEYRVEEDPDRSTFSHKVYDVKMVSLGGVMVHGWLTVPRIRGAYPVLVGLPGYKVILQPLYAEDFVTFQFNIRSAKATGEIVSDKESDYTLYDIDDKDKYIYRGAYMDCIRAIDFLSNYKDQYLGIDPNRIVLSGGSQGGALALVIAGLDHRVKACIADNPIYCDIHNLISISEKRNPVEWPVNRYKEYLQKSPYLNMRSIANTMDYYDPQNFTPMIQCPVLLGLGLLDKLAPPVTIIAAFNKLSSATMQKSETYSFNNLAHEVTLRHRKFQSQWVLEKLATSKN